MSASTPATASTRDARGVLVNVAGLVAQAALPAFHVQLARFLGAGGYGLYTWSSAVVDVLSVVTLFGLDQAVIRQVSLHKRDSARAVGTALRVVVLSGLAVFVAMVLVAPLVARVQGKPGLVAPLRWLALVPLFYHVSTVFLVATQALAVMRWAFWARSIVQPLVLLAATGAVLRAGSGAGGAAAAVVAGMAATAVVSAVLYGRELPLGETLRATVRGKLEPETLRVASPIVFANLLWAVLARVDLFLLGHYGAEAQLGAYAACALYAASISQIRSAFDPVTTAGVAPALARGDVEGLSAAIQRQTRWLALAAFPLLALFVGFGEPLLAVFGKGFRGAELTLGILALGHTVNSLALASFVLPLSGHGRYTTFAAAGALVLETVLGVILVPRLGLVGAALAFASGIGVAQIAQLTLAQRLVGVRGISMHLVTTLACAAVALALGRTVYAVLPWSLAPRFFAGVGLSAAVYVALAWSFAVGPEDRALARSALRRPNVVR